MTVTLIRERTGIEDEAVAKLLKDILADEGYEVEITKAANGTFTVTGKKVKEPATNPSGGGAVLIEGTAPSSGAGIDGLLDFIAEFESGGNYNAYYGQGANQNNPKFTSKTLKGVLEWQTRFLENGSKSSAIGKYQILKKTLVGLIGALDLDESSTRFTQDTQNAMARKLLEGRGWNRFVSGTVSVEDFATEVAKEWAAMPVIQATTRVVDGRSIQLVAGQSYYDGDGLNSALTSADSFKDALTKAKST